MGSKRRPLGVITLGLCVSLCAVMLSRSTQTVTASGADSTDPDGIGRVSSLSNHVGPAGRNMSRMHTPASQQTLQGVVVDKERTWNDDPVPAGPGGSEVLLYDNGDVLDDFGDPATQLSLEFDGALFPWLFAAEAADDFVLVDPVSPDTNFLITRVRAGFSFFMGGAESASPRQTWSEGVYVVVYNNSAVQNEPDGVSDFIFDDPSDPGNETFNDAVAAQLVTSGDLNEMLVDGCRDCWVVDIPVNFVLAKNTQYWLSIVPRYPAEPQTAWCLSDENHGFPAQRGASFDFFPWNEISGNDQDNDCMSPVPPPPGSNKDLSFKIYGREFPAINIACCDEVTGMCREIVSPMTCLPSEETFVGVACQFVDCDIITGSCCDDMAGTCTDDVNIGACSTMRFTPDVACAAVSPPCGTVDSGACCLTGQTCLELNPTDCSFLGGTWNAGNCTSFECPSDNDQCILNPILIGDGAFPFNTIGSTTDGPPGGPCADVENDIWFQYFASCDGLLTVSLCLDTDYDSAVEVYEGCGSCPADFTSLVACADDGCGDPMGASSLTVSVQETTCYLIRIGGVGGATGSGTLVVGCTPPNQGACCVAPGDCSLTMMVDCTGDFFLNEPCSPINCPAEDNDLCDEAIAISQNGIYLFETINATTDGPADSPGGICTEVNQDVWFAYTAICTGLLDVSLCGAVDYDSALAIYDGCACPPMGGPLACDDNGCGPGGASEIQNLAVVKDNCYLIRIGGAGMSVGTGALTITCTPGGGPPGACCEGDVSGNNVIDINDLPLMVAALLDPPAMAAPEFCPADVNADMVIDGLDIEPFVNLLISGAICQQPVTGACCFIDGMCMEIEQLDCFAMMGVYQGNNTVCTPNPCPQPPEPPVNDECAEAIGLSCNIQVVFSNELATTNFADDPVFSCHFGGAAQGDGTGWYTFVATDTDALISTCNTLPPVTDTLIAIYDTTGCPVLLGDELACNEDAGGSCQRLSELCVTGLTPGQEYTIQVATFDGTPRGDIVLDLFCPCPRGACCFVDGSCQELRSDECLAMSGQFQGNGVSCDPNPCSPPVPVECCIGDLNVDGMIDSLDIPFLVTVLLDPPLLGTPEFCRADIDEDKAVDGRDITAFIPLMLNPMPCPLPSNDDCASPLLLSCDTRIVVENTYATTDVSDPEYTCLSGGQGQGTGTLWFSFVATEPNAFISTCDLLLPDLDTILAVYDAPCPSIGNELACNEDAGGLCDRFSELCVGGLTIGNTYYVQVSSSSMNELGFISVEVICPCP